MHLPTDLEAGYALMIAPLDAMQQPDASRSPTALYPKNSVNKAILSYKPIRLRHKAQKQTMKFALTFHDSAGSRPTSWSIASCNPHFPSPLTFRLPLMQTCPLPLNYQKCRPSSPSHCAVHPRCLTPGHSAGPPEFCLFRALCSACTVGGASRGGGAGEEHPAAPDRP